MDRKLVVIAALSIISLIMSAVTAYTVFKPGKSEAQSWYSITANSAIYYRLYAHLNGKTIIADEAIGIKLYSLEATAGDKIEIVGFCQAENPDVSYSDNPFTVEFAQEGPYSLIATQRAQQIIVGSGTLTISIKYTVP
jgi:hypothetical protein